MATKKDESRFTIRFNTENPRHNEAIQILNKHGKGMASLIADALYMYVHGATNFNSPHNESAGLDITFLTAQPAEISEQDFQDTLNTALSAFT